LSKQSILFFLLVSGNNEGGNFWRHCSTINNLVLVVFGCIWFVETQGNKATKHKKVFCHEKAIDFAMFYYRNHSRIVVATKCVQLQAIARAPCTCTFWRTARGVDCRNFLSYKNLRGSTVTCGVIMKCLYLRIIYKLLLR
jgi:hypothetical protein